MDSDNDSYHSENEFYYPDEETFFKKKKIIVNTSNDTKADEEMSTIQDFIEKQRPENTTKKTAYDINVLKRFCSSIGAVRELENISSGSLKVLLCKFFMDDEKKDRGVYEPASLSSFQRCIQRYLKDKNSSREVPLAKKRELVEKHAKGNRPQAARSITPSEEDLLFHTKQFGDHNPGELQRTVWWVLSLHFGFRARDESRKLRCGDIVLDPHGGEVLVWKAQRGSKTRHGVDTHQREFNPTAQATNNERCPLKLFKKFSAHRREKMKHPDSPFYLLSTIKESQSQKYGTATVLSERMRLENSS